MRLGGALNIRMKDGFSFQGGKLELQGGSYGRIQAGLEYGKQIGNFATYVALEAAHDDGYRDFGSSLVQRFYGDLGYRAEGNEIHLSLSVADNLFGAAATTPIQLVAAGLGRRLYDAADHPERDGHGDAFGQVHAVADLEPVVHRLCPPLRAAGAGRQPDRCAGLRRWRQSLLQRHGHSGQRAERPATPDSAASPTPWGCRLAKSTAPARAPPAVGASVQLSNTDTLFGYKNHLSFGASYDYSQTTFGASAELGVIQPNYVVAGSGVYLGPSGDPVSDGPVDVHTINRYFGLNILDAFDLTDKLTISAARGSTSLRSRCSTNWAASVTGEHDYTHINPVVGLTYKITPNLQAYASYAESNRAPTPLELGCSNPLQPCIIGSFPGQRPQPETGGGAHL